MSFASGCRLANYVIELLSCSRNGVLGLACAGIAGTDEFVCLDGGSVKVDGPTDRRTVAAGVERGTGNREGGSCWMYPFLVLG